MTNSSPFRFILIYRKSRLQELIERFNTWPQARFYLEHNQTDSEDYLREHDLYKQRLIEAEKTIRPLGRFQLLERSFLPNYLFSPNDIVVVIGQDGLVANTLKYLNGQPVIAINPDPDRWDGALLPFEIGQLSNALRYTISGKAASKSITFANASSNNGQSMLAVNDLFIGPKSHTSARYKINWKGETEIQSSSGIIVSTGLGSTGWFQSILAGAIGVTGQDKHALQHGFAWDEARLQFAVREPFPSQNTGVNIVFGAVDMRSNIQLESLMPENGVIFSDGIEADYIPFNAGAIVKVDIAETRGMLICE